MESGMQRGINHRSYANGHVDQIRRLGIRKQSEVREYLSKRSVAWFQYGHENVVKNDLEKIAQIIFKILRIKD